MTIDLTKIDLTKDGPISIKYPDGTVVTGKLVKIRAKTNSEFHASTIFIKEETR